MVAFTHKAIGVPVVGLVLAASIVADVAGDSQCGSQPTIVYVNKGEKKLVSFWSTSASATAPVEGSGEPTALQAEGTTHPSTGAGSADGGDGAPVIVVASAVETPAPTRLYDQQPHIILPEAPTLDTEPLAADATVQHTTPTPPAVIEPPQEMPETLPTAELAVTSPVETSAALTETDGVSPTATISPISHPPVDHNTSFHIVDGASPIHNAIIFYNDINGSGSRINSDEADVEQLDQAVQIEQTLVNIQALLEGSGVQPFADENDNVEGSGAHPDAITSIPETTFVSKGTGSSSSTPPDVSPLEVTSVIQHVQTLVASRHPEADDLDEDELLPLVEQHDSVQQLLSTLQSEDGDLQVSASHFSPVVGAGSDQADARTTHATQENKADTEQFATDKLIEDGSGHVERAELRSAAVKVASDDGEIQEGSGFTEGRDSSAESANEVAVLPTNPDGNQEKYKANTDAKQSGNSTPEIPRSSAPNKKQRNSFYRLIDSYDSSYPVQQVRVSDNAPSYIEKGQTNPALTGQHVAAQLSRVTSNPWRPYTAGYQPPFTATTLKPNLSESLHHGSSRIRFPSRYQRPSNAAFYHRRHHSPGTTRNTVPYTRDRGAIYRTNSAGNTFRWTPRSRATQGGKVAFNAEKSLRHLDEDFFSFLNSQPYPVRSALLYSRPQPRSMRDSWRSRHSRAAVSWERPSWAKPGTWGRGGRSAGVNCEWIVQTEPHLYLLMTLHNLSAPLTVDCMGAYIEVERENDGFEARWCGNRVRKEGSRPHLVFARGEVRIAVQGQYAAEDASERGDEITKAHDQLSSVSADADDDGGGTKSSRLPLGFDAEVEVIDLLDARQYATFRRSGLNFRRLIQQPLLPDS